MFYLQVFKSIGTVLKVFNRLQNQYNSRTEEIPRCKAMKVN